MRGTLLAAAAILLSACTTQETQTPPYVAGHQPVMRVDEVSVVTTRKMPPSLIIRAKGTAQTAGWTDPILVPLQTFAPEGDVRSFTLMAKPPSPSIPVAQVLTPVEASVVLDPMPEGVKTIRILSATNEATASLVP